MASVNNATNQVVGQQGQELNKLLASMLADLTKHQTAIKAITAKLDADSGVAGTDYASTCDPAALTTTT